MPKLEFLNVDLDMLFKREPKILLEELKGKVAVLYSGQHPKGHFVALELNSYVKDPHKALQKWIKLFGTLTPPARRELRRATSRVLDAGFDVSTQGRADRIELPETLVMEFAKLGCAYAITLYAEDPDESISVREKPNKRKSPPPR